VGVGDGKELLREHPRLLELGNAHDERIDESGHSSDGSVVLEVFLGGKLLNGALDEPVHHWFFGEGDRAAGAEQDHLVQVAEGPDANADGAACRGQSAPDGRGLEAVRDDYPSG
jgi:hypothetical protein